MANQRSLPRLPALLQRLTSADWQRLRALLAQLDPGDEEAVATSIGYVDLGKLPTGGLGYVGAMSNDADDRGPLQYRKAMSGAWPK